MHNMIIDERKTASDLDGLLNTAIPAVNCNGGNINVPNTPVHVCAPGVVPAPVILQQNHGNSLAALIAAVHTMQDKVAHLDLKNALIANLWAWKGSQS